MIRKVVFMIDGWFMRKTVYSTKAFYYSGEEIRKYCCSHLKPQDYLYRIFYYDTEPLNKKGTHPLTGNTIDFATTRVAQAQEALFKSIRETPNFALRLGKTVWRNNEWILTADKFKALLQKRITVDSLVEDDIRPLIEQKAVDMKLGLDITYIATKRLADLLIIITGDADIVPALKFARREGMQVCLDPLRRPIRPELSEHVDFIETKIPKTRKTP
jgi:uncharacterized LabA/DUF88 family protein